MIFPVVRRALTWLPRPGSRALTVADMEVALRGVRKILCVAEKNDAAKGIADLLSGGRMRRVRRPLGGRNGDERPLLPLGVLAVGPGPPGASCDRRAFRNGVITCFSFAWRPWVRLARRRMPSGPETRNRRPHSPDLLSSLRGHPPARPALQSRCIRQGDPPEPLFRRY